MKWKKNIYFLYFWIPFVNMQLQFRIIFQQDTKKSIFITFKSDPTNTQLKKNIIYAIAL